MSVTNIETAKKKLSEFVRLAETEEVLITINNKPRVIMVDYGHFNRLLDYIEDLEDKISCLEYDLVDDSEEVGYPIEQLIKEYGLEDKISS